MQWAEPKTKENASKPNKWQTKAIVHANQGFFSSLLKAGGAIHLTYNSWRLKIQTKHRRYECRH